ncbi:hypothetical protein COOONC_21220 [Cooperia oncophora]
MMTSAFEAAQISPCSLQKLAQDCGLGPVDETLLQSSSIAEHLVPSLCMGLSGLQLSSAQEVRLAKITPNPFIQREDGPPPDMKIYHHPHCLFEMFFKAACQYKGH